MEAFNFISFIGWSLRSSYYKRKSPVFLIKCLQTVRELEKMALFPEKFSSGSSQVEYKLTRGRSLENILRSLDQWGVEDNPN
jgi:hypothetical protein